MKNNNFDEIDNNKKGNGVIKNLKIFGHSIKRVAPYIIAGAVLFEAFSFNGSTPFIKDSSYIYVKYIKEWDSNGNATIVQDGDIYSKDPLTDELVSTSVLYYTEWIKNEDGTYYRTKYSYGIDNLVFNDALLEEILDCKDYLELNEFLVYKSDVQENANSLSPEVLHNNKGYVVVRTTDTDYTMPIMYIQNSYNNACETVAYFAALTGLFAAIAYIRKRNGYSYQDIVRDIKENYKVDSKMHKFKVELLDEEEQEEEVKKDGYSYQDMVCDIKKSYKVDSKNHKFKVELLDEEGQEKKVKKERKLI
jgi:hypothetical protein